MCNYQQGNPTDTQVTWKHNTTLLQASDSDITIELTPTSTTLTRANLPVNGGGFYTCTLTNGIGTTDQALRVTVQCKFSFYTLFYLIQILNVIMFNLHCTFTDPPSAPTNLMVTERTNVSILFSWRNQFDGFSPISSFRVNYQGKNDATPLEITFTGSATTTSYNLTSLTPLSDYTIDLRVRNQAGLEGDAGVLMNSTLSNCAFIKIYGLLVSY